MNSQPKIGRFLDDEEAQFVQSFEEGATPSIGGLSSQRRSEVEAMARATMSDERAKISLRVAKRDLVLLKSRALQEGVPYQTLINSLIHRYVTE